MTRLLLPRHLGGTKYHPRQQVTDEERLLAQQRLDETQRFRALQTSQRAAESRARRYQVEDEERAYGRQMETEGREFDRQQSLLGQEFGQRRTLQGDELAGRMGLAEFGAEQDRLQAADQYGYQRGLAELGHGFDERMAILEGDISAQSQTRYMDFQEYMARQNADLEAESAVLQNQLDELSAISGDERRFGYGQLEADAAAGRMEVRDERLNQYGIEGQKLGAQIDRQKEQLRSRLDANKQRAEWAHQAQVMLDEDDRHLRDGALTHLRDVDKMAYQQDSVMFALRYQDVLAKVNGGTHEYTEDTDREISELQRQLSVTESNDRLDPEAKAYGILQLKRKLNAAMLKVAPVPSHRRQRNALERISASTVFEDLATGERFSQPGIGRVPVTVVMGRNGEPTLDYGRNRPKLGTPDPSKAVNPATGRTAKEETDARKDIREKFRTRVQELYDELETLPDGKQTRRVRTYSEAQEMALREFYSDFLETGIVAGPQESGPSGPPGMAGPDPMARFNAESQDVIRRATTPVPASSLRGGQPAQPQPAVSPWKWEGTGEPPDVVEARKRISEASNAREYSPSADPWMEMANPNPNMFRTGQLEKDRATVAQWEKEGTSPWLKKQQATRDSWRQSLPRFKTDAEIDAAIESGQLQPGQYLIGPDGKTYQLRGDDEHVR